MKQMKKLNGLTLVLAGGLLVSGLVACERAEYQAEAEPGAEQESQPGSAYEDEVTDLGEAISDTTITAQVKAALGADDRTSALDIDVDTREGVVTLTGTVESNAERRAAARVARSVEGVQEVVNELQSLAPSDEPEGAAG